MPFCCEISVQIFFKKPEASKTTKFTNGYFFKSFIYFKEGPKSHRLQTPALYYNEIKVKRLNLDT